MIIDRKISTYNRISNERSLAHRLVESLLAGGNEIGWNGAPNDCVDKLYGSLAIRRIAKWNRLYVTT